MLMRRSSPSSLGGKIAEGASGLITHILLTVIPPSGPVLMTLLELATWICNKHEATDTTSLARAKDFLKNRWAFIWNKHPWRETKDFATVEVAADTQTVEMPEACAAILGLRWGDSRELAPMEVEMVLRMHPHVWDQSGEPYGYSIMEKTAAGLLQIRLFRKPETAKDLLVLYKKPVPVLTDSDSPALLGIDQALLAFGEGDFLEYRHQYGKAQIKFEEGGAMLAEIYDQELNQTATTRQLVPEDGGWDSHEPDSWLRKI